MDLMQEQFADLGEITLCYETFGDPSEEALLLVMGLGTQMVAWHEDFCRRLADRGFFVIRYDNRDVGRSTRLDDVPPPSPIELATRRFKQLAYTLEDMADDGARLLDHLGIERAHVVGASMGGMLAQIIAVRHADRVLSLTSIMSTTGGRWVGQPALKVYPFFLAKPPTTKEAYVDRAIKLFRVVGSTTCPDRESDLRETAERSYERGLSPGGLGRQLAAIMHAGDRTVDVRRVDVPTLVIHGTADKLVRPSGGKATHQAIQGSRLMLIEGMGHDLPRGAWDRIADGIAENARRGRPLGEDAAQAA